MCFYSFCVWVICWEIRCKVPAGNIKFHESHCFLLFIVSMVTELIWFLILKQWRKDSSIMTRNNCKNLMKTQKMRTLRAWLHEPGWFGVPRWLSARYYMRRASPVDGWWDEPRETGESLILNSITNFPEPLLDPVVTALLNFCSNSFIFSNTLE